MPFYVEEQRSGAPGGLFCNLHRGIPARWIEGCLDKGNTDRVKIESSAHRQPLGRHLSKHTES